MVRRAAALFLALGLMSLAASAAPAGLGAHVDRGTAEGGQESASMVFVRPADRPVMRVQAVRLALPLVLAVAIAVVGLSALRWRWSGGLERSAPARSTWFSPIVGRAPPLSA